MIMKKGDHNTGVSDGTKKLFNGKKSTLSKKDILSKNFIKNLKKCLIKNLKNDALLRKLIKSIKKVLYQKRYFIKNLIKNLKKRALSKNLNTRV